MVHMMELVEKDEYLQRTFTVGCIAHWLNLAAKDILKENSFYDKILAITQFMARNQGAHAALRQRGIPLPPQNSSQERSPQNPKKYDIDHGLVYPKPKKFISSTFPVSDTRWSIAFRVTEWYNKYWSQCVEIIASLLKPGETIRRDVENVQIRRGGEDLAAMLRPLCVAIDLVQAEGYNLAQAVAARLSFKGGVSSQCEWSFW